MDSICFHNVTELRTCSDGKNLQLYVVKADGTKIDIVLFRTDDEPVTVHECDSLGDKT